MEKLPKECAHEASKDVFDNHQQLNFENYCAFCLKWNNQNPSVIGRALGGNVENFKVLINYLIGRDLNEVDKFCEMGVASICEGCYNGFYSLNALHQQLVSVQCSIQIQTELLRDRINGTIKKRKVGGVNGGGMSATDRERFNDFICNSSGMPESEARKAFDFISELHDLIIAKDKCHVTFPSKVQPKPCTSMGLSVEAGDGVTLKSISALSSVPLKKATIVHESEFDKSTVKVEVEENDTNDDAFEDSFEYQQANNEREENEDLDSLPVDSQVKEEDNATTDTDNKDDSWNLRRSTRNKGIFPFSTSKPLKHFRRNETKQKITNVQTNKLSIKRDLDDNPETLKNPENTPTRKKRRRKAGSSKKKKSYKRIYILKEKTQMCDLCKETVLSVKMEEHMRLHVKDYAVKCPCPTCPRWFSCIHKMERHMFRMTDSKGPHGSTPLPDNFPKTICPLCDLRMNHYGSYRLHLDEHENVMNDDKPYECPIPLCSQRYSLKESLECHIFYHKNLRVTKAQQKCNICKESIPTEEMEQHLKESHQTSEPVPCKHCKFVFPDRLTLVDHIYDHRDEKGIACDICPDRGGLMKFSRLHDLRQHYAMIHNIGQPANEDFPCEHCPSVLSSLGGLNSHQVRMHPEHFQSKSVHTNNPEITCELCHNKFKTKGRYQVHKIKVHGADPFKCKQCGETFLRWDLYKNHERNKHQGRLNEIKCEVEGCGQIFYCRKHLEIHQLSKHSGGEKPFKCDYTDCDKAYWTKGHLNQHKKKFHMGIKGKEKCEECGEYLSSKKALKLHKLIHTGERPFSCHICGQAFRQQEVMDRHIQSHETKGDSFKPKGPMKNIRKRVERSQTAEGAQAQSTNATSL